MVFEEWQGLIAVLVFLAWTLFCLKIGVRGIKEKRTPVPIPGHDVALGVAVYSGRFAYAPAIIWIFIGIAPVLALIGGLLESYTSFDLAMPVLIISALVVALILIFTLSKRKPSQREKMDLGTKRLEP